DRELIVLARAVEADRLSQGTEVGPGKDHLDRPGRDAVAEIGERTRAAGRRDGDAARAGSRPARRPCAGRRRATRTGGPRRGPGRRGGAVAAGAGLAVAECWGSGTGSA